MNRSSTKVVIVAFEGISAFHLSVPCLVFHDAFAMQGEHPFDVKVTTLGGKDLCAASSFGLHIEQGLELLSTADIIVIPSWHDVTTPQPEALIDALIAAYQRGATLAGLCLGAFVLAATGLLKGKSATTHWAGADEFVRQFPDVQFDPEPLYIDQGQLITSAGTVAAIDCCLHMVRNQLGCRVVTQLARMLVTAPYRLGGQKQYIPAAVTSRSGQTAIAAVMDSIRDNVQQHYTIDDVAVQCAMSRRTFTRHFKATVGVGFHEWLVGQRLHYSQQLLESVDDSISWVAERSGFGSESAYRKHFKQAFSVSPTQWRAAFRGHVVFEN